MKLFRLRPEHAEAVARLADSLYPGGFAMDPSDIAENLEGDDHLCFGIEEEGELAAFLMSWKDVSQLEGRECDEILLIDDICVTPRHRRHVFTLLKAMVSGLAERGLQGIPLEGQHRLEADVLFSRHARVIARLGYERVLEHRFFSEHGEELVWTRYEAHQGSVNDPANS